jgi:hypothetical protein
MMDQRFPAQEFHRFTALLLETVRGTTNRDSHSGESTPVRTPEPELKKDPITTDVSTPTFGSDSSLIFLSSPSNERLSGAIIPCDDCDCILGPTPDNRQREKKRINDLEKRVKVLQFQIVEEKARVAKAYEKLCLLIDKLCGLEEGYR